MKITKQQVKELKHLINNETCNSSEVKDKIKEILPQLLNPFEVGKYYTFQNEECDFIFKVTALKHTKLGYKGAYGYGIDMKNSIFGRNYRIFYRDIIWVTEHDVKKGALKEVSKEKFLEYIIDYAEEVLGFKEGVEFKSTENSTYIARGKLEINTLCDEVIIFSGSGGAVFNEGKFAQVNKKSLIFEDNLTLGNAEVWEKTMDLRWQWDMVFDSQNTSKLARVLQQKWVENNTGTAKWENI